MIRVSVVDAAGRAVRAPGLARWLARVAPSRAAGDLTVAIVSDARMRALNRQYRKKDSPTDVLSFAQARGGGAPRASEKRPRPSRGAGVPNAPGALGWPAGGKRGRNPRRRATARGGGAPRASENADRDLGDIVIAKGVAARQARRFGHPLPAELKILALHGLLHLLGYDHETDKGQMAQLEQRLRRKGGLREGLTERGRRLHTRGRGPSRGGGTPRAS